MSDGFSLHEAHLLELCILKSVRGAFCEPAPPKSTCAGEGVFGILKTQPEDQVLEIVSDNY